MVGPESPLTSVVGIASSSVDASRPIIASVWSMVGPESPLTSVVGIASSSVDASRLIIASTGFMVGPELHPHTIPKAKPSKRRALTLREVRRRGLVFEGSAFHEDGLAGGLE
jgi:hypothetical protein